MKNHQAAEIRNFALVGHASAGKTMLGECMLACGGVINRLGSVANGTTQSDFTVTEKERQISISAALLHVEWLDRKFNFVDTPGYLDFISESLGALRVSDFAVVVVNAAHGLGVGTEQVWKHATAYNLPKIIVLNGLDKEHVSYEEALAKIRARFGDRVLPLSFPVNPGPGFSRILDVFRNTVLTYRTDGSGKHDESSADGPLKNQADTLHQQLVESTAESDDQLLERFFDEGGLSEDELRAGVHKAFEKQSFIPLFCTSAETNVGVTPLMDFIARDASSPLDRPRTKALDADGADVEVGPADASPVLYVFKTSSEGQAGDLSFFRLFAGKLEAGTDLYNADTKASERIGQIFILNGKNREPVNLMHAGDMGALVKLKATHTDNTLSDSKRHVTLPKVTYPRPNIHQALRLKSKGEEDKIASGLAALHGEDPTFLYHSDPELHQTVISGQGDLHLQVVAEKLRRRHKVDFDLVEPKVPYRETIKGRGESKYRHKKQTGGAGQFAEVWMRIEPTARDTGVEFTESLVGQNVDRVFVPSVEKGVMAACKEGIIAGYRVVDVKIDFYDGKMHPVDSKDIAFQIAGKEGFKEAFRAAKPCLLEPIYTVEIRIPDEFMGNVIGDLSSRRGKIAGMDSADGYQIVKATVPQKELYQYATVLRSLTAGRGIHTEDFDHYEEMPRDLESKVIAETKKAADEEKQ
ncbi:MAG: elongation factor G [Verrucomicrobia bacterium]|nr:elongation factor G [Verrucomicrobiota bacterium]